MGFFKTLMLSLIQAVQLQNGNPYYSINIKKIIETSFVTSKLRDL